MLPAAASVLPRGSLGRSSSLRFEASDLHNHCRSGDVSLLESYLHDTVTPSVNQRAGETGLAPLHEAAIAGHCNVIRLLKRELEELDMNIRTDEGPASTPLHLAAKNDNASSVIALIECGAILNAVDRCWRTPLDVALEYDAQNVVHVISMYEMCKAAESESLPLLEKLLQKVTSYQMLPESLQEWHQSLLNTALLMATKRGNRHVVSKLIAYGANNFTECIDITQQNNHITAFLYLCRAIVDEDTDVIDIILAPDEQQIEGLPRYNQLMIYRVILAPLLQNGKVTLSVPLKVALTAGKLSIAGRILQYVSHHPGSGVIDWHDLDLTYVDPHWLQGHGINSLTYVGLSFNKLRVVPEQIVRFNNLQKIQIHHNRITCLPSDLFTLPRIAHIDVSFNCLTSLPTVLRQRIAPTLETLNLANNKLETLPDYLIHSKIALLDISFNWFYTLPDCISQMRHLHTLSLNHNIGMEVIPYQLGNLRNLNFLGIEGLPYIKNIPSKGKTAPIEFLRARGRTLQIVTHYDVAVVGTEEPYHPCLERVYTAIEQQSKRKHFSCLKFSNTKQFLHFQKSLSLPCTLYVIVWDCQSDQPADELLYHINHLVLYAPCNVIIIVAACWVVPVTPVQEKWVEDQLKRSSWKRFRNRVVIVTITIDQHAVVDRSYSVQSLLDVIDKKGSSIRSRLVVPNSYFVLTDYISRESKRLLEDNKPSLISSWDMWELVRSSPHHDLASHKELSLVLSYLTSVASIVSLSSNRSNERDYHTLNRQWFLDVMSGLLIYRSNMSISSGLFPLTSLCDLFNSPSHFSEVPVALYTYISQLGLAIPVTNHNALVSTMLPSHNTTSLADFSNQYQVRRVYTFLSTPVSFWSRLIAHLLINMNHFITSVSSDSAGEPLGGCRSPLPDTLPRDVANWSYWRDGITVWLYGSQLVYSIEAIQDTSHDYREGLQILVSSTELGLQALNTITVTINSFLKCWYPQLWETVELKALCPYDSSHSYFPLKDCCHLLLNKSLSFTCEQDQKPLSVADLIPDLFNDDLSFVSINDLDVNIHDKSSCLNRPPLETVFRGDFNDISIAVKPFPPPNSNTTTPFLDYWYELSVLNHIRQSQQSPYLIELLMSTIDPLTLIFRCAVFCSLEEVILESSILLLPLLRVRMVYQLASGLETLHSLQVIHRNICLENILVYSLSLDDHVNIKLCGYSSSCVEIHHVSKGECGTYPAPEMSIPGYEYDQRVDVFSFAFTSYEILTRKKLKCRRGVKFQTASGHYERPNLKALSSVSPYFMPLLEKCWTAEPNKRPFFAKIVQHFQKPIHNLAREGLCVNDNHEYNAAAVRYTRQTDGTFSCHLYICSSILSAKDSTILSHLSLPGLNIENSTSLPSQCIICMACTTDYLWVSFQFQFVRVYSATTLEFIKEIQFDCHVLVMAVSPNSIYLGKEDGEIHVYNLVQPSPLHSPDKTHVIHYQQPIKSLQVLDDSVVCCTKQLFIRIHPVTLQTIHEFSIPSEAPVKCAVMAVDRNSEREYLWVGFRRLQQVVVFDAITGKAMYGINCCEVLYKERSEVWVTCLQVVLDTVWVGLNTGHILSFSAYSPTPLLLTYLKAHTENVRQLIVLQPSYWEPNTRFCDEESLSEEEEELTASYSLPSPSPVAMPRVAPVLSCGQGIEKMLPRVSMDGVVLTSRTEDINGLLVIKYDGPDSTGARKLECQAHRSLRPYMDSYTYDMEPIYNNEHSFSSTFEHRSIPNGITPVVPIERPNPKHDPDLVEYECVSFSDLSQEPPHTNNSTSDNERPPHSTSDGRPPHSTSNNGRPPHSTSKGGPPHSNGTSTIHDTRQPPHTSNGRLSPQLSTRSKSFSVISTLPLDDSDEEGGEGYVQMRSASVLQTSKRITKITPGASIRPALMEHVESLQSENTDDDSIEPVPGKPQIPLGPEQHN